jgi:GrpB-like predicted nucleotidyltransferase (UPF0157 family)
MLIDMVEVVEYNLEWSERFEELRKLYSAALADAGVPFVAIEHVGSTSVPGLAGKPIVDVDIVVEPGDVEAATTVLLRLGFASLGELGIPQRWAFREPAGWEGTNTYVIVDGSLALKNHLCLRETLRRNTRLRDEYGDVKRAVASYASDIVEYGQGKNSVIQKILATGGLSAEELASIDGQQGPGPEVAR